MATTYHEEIQKLYVAYFNRPADPAGLAHWQIAVEAANGDTAAVSASFAASDEYRTEYARLTNAEVVDQVYQNLFGRKAEETGKKYWADLLNAGTLTIDKVVAAIADGAVGTDKVAFESKVEYALAFTAELNTEAEIAGYNTESVDAAKAIVAGIKTAADLEDALDAATLKAAVAEVVKAGTPFTMQGALASFQAAVEAKAAFLEEVDLGETAIEDGVLNAETALDAEVTGYFNDIDGDGDNDASAVMKAALLADEQAARAAELKAAQDEVKAANKAIADEDAALPKLVATLKAANLRAETTQKALDLAIANLAGAEATFETRNSIDFTIDASTGIAEDPSTGADIGLLAAGSTDNTVKAATGVNETTNPGITALVSSINAYLAALAADTKADDVQADAESAVDDLDPGLDLFGDLEVAEGDVLLAAKEIEKLNDLVADLADAKEYATALEALNDAIDAAAEVFVENDLSAPVILDAAITVATADSDFFVADLETADAELAMFSTLGTDYLYIGEGYTLNTGKLSTGDDAALEVFISQSGADTKLEVEVAKFGSSASTPDTVIITLIGVDADDVVMTNGIITLKGTDA